MTKNEKIAQLENENELLKQQIAVLTQYVDALRQSQTPPPLNPTPIIPYTPYIPYVPGTSPDVYPWTVGDPPYGRGPTWSNGAGSNTTLYSKLGKIHVKELPNA